MRTDHLPFPMPERAYSLDQEWKFLTFMHWEVDPKKLAKFIPDGLEIDLYDGRAYIGVIPFIMANVRPRVAFSVPGISTFPEINIRTYVKRNGKAGVLFLTLEAQSMVTCAYAPRAYGLPYRYSIARVSASEGSYKWETRRRDGGHRFVGECKWDNQGDYASRGTLEEFLFERYCLYTTHKGKLCVAYTHHEPWKFGTGTVKIESNSLTKEFDLGIEELLTPDMVHVSEGVFVKTWSAEVVK